MKGSFKRSGIRTVIFALLFGIFAVAAWQTVSAKENTNESFLSSVFAGVSNLFAENKTENTATLTNNVSDDPVIGTCDTAGPIEVESSGGVTTPTAYATLKLAFDAINAGTHTGSINIEVCGSTTEGTTPANLNSSGAGSASYTSVNIYPLADGLIISGNPVTGFGVIQLNGADNVTINGDNPNTAGINRNLTVSNTAAATVIANSAIRIATSAAVTSADNDTIKNLVLLGNVTGGNLSSITSTTGSSNSSFGIYVGGNGGATATGAPTAITSVTTNTAPTGTTVNNLVINNNSVNQAARGIVFNGATAAISNGVTISNNTVGATATLTGNPPYTTPTTTVYTKGIYIAGTNSVTITGNTVQNILSYVGTLVSGIELNSAIGSGQISIRGNTLNGIVNNGTSSNATRGISVVSSAGAYNIGVNTITNVQNSSGSTTGQPVGIVVGTAAPSGVIERNKVQTVVNRNTGTFGAFGIQLGGGNNITIKNNFISDVNQNISGGASFLNCCGVYGLLVGSGTGHKIYNNSVNLFGALLGTSTSGNSTAAMFITSTTLTGIDARNNILANTMTGGTTSTAHVSLALPASGTSAMNLTLNNNDYFSGSTAGQSGIAHVGTTYTAVPAGPTTYAGLYTAANFNPADTSSTTNLRTYTSLLSAAGTNDNASITSDPQFVSSTNLHVASGSPVVNAGVDVGVTNDIDNDTRVGNPDIGADEPGGIPQPANDIAATAINVPTNGASYPFGGSFSPQATFSNVGSAAQTNVQVQFTISGPGGYSYTDTQTITTIDPDQNVTVTFAATPAFTTAGTYTTTATVVTADSNPANNTQNGSFQVVAPVSGTVNVGTGGDYTSLTNPGGIFDVLNTAGATGNVTINITSDLSGETGSIPLNELSGGFTVLIKPSGAARSITSTGSAVSVIKLNDADNVTIDGSLSGGTDRSLSITNTNTAASTAVIWVASNTNGAQNNTVKNVNLAGGFDQSTGSVFNFAIISSSSAAITTGGTDNDNNTFTNNFVRKVSVGILSIGGLAANPNQNTTISNNLIGPASFGSDQISTLGMLLFNENAPQITGNELRFIGDSATSGGSSARDHVGISLCTGSASWSGTTAPTVVGTVTNANVSRNSIHDIVERATFSSAGIVNNCPNTSPTNNVIANNMIYNILANGTSGDQTVGIGISNGNGDTVAYNSIYLTGDIDPAGASASSTSSFGINAGFANAQNLTLKNNISVMDLNSNTGTLLHAALNLQSASFNFGTGGSDFNDLYANPANTQARVAATGGSGGTFYADLMAYQTAVAPQDANSKSVDPFFVSPTDLHIQMSSPVIGMATPLAAVTNDFDGQTRDGMPDIGADEFVVLVPGTLQFSSATYSVGEGGGTVTLTVTRTGGSDGAVTVDYSLGGGTATGGASCGGAVDYVNTGGTVMFANGEMSKTFNVAICDDAALEGSETFDATLSNATGGATIGTPSTATVTITDNEVAMPGTLQFSSATYSVGEAGPTATITVTRTGGSDGAVTADYATSNGTATGGASCATPGVDFVNTSGTVTFGNGVTTPQTFNIPICDDTAVEGSETVNLALSNVTGGATLGTPNTAVLTITDNDMGGDTTINVGTGETVTSLTNAGGAFDVINGMTVSGNITVNITSDLTAETGAVALNEFASGFTVTIKPSGAARTVSGTSGASSGLIILNGADNVTIDGSLSGGTDRSLTITNATTTSAVIWMRSTAAPNGCNNDTIKNTNLAGSVATNIIAGVLSGSSTFGSAAQAPQSNNTIQNNRVIKVQNAAFLSGNAATFDQNWMIVGNTFGSTVASEKLSFRGMLIGGANNFTISENTIMGINSSTTTSSTMTGIQLSANSSNGFITRNSISNIRHNNPSGFGANGIFLSQTNTAANVLVANNFIWDVTGVGFAGVGQADNGYGIVVNTGGGYKIYFNSVNLATDQTAAGSITAAVNITSTVTTAGAVDLRDNILVNTETVGTRFAVIDSSTQGAAVFSNINYNDYFAQNVGRSGTTTVVTYPTLANWQGFTGMDANSQSVDPLFVSATNLHLQPTSPVADDGQPLADVTVDIDGEARSATTPDIGADEFAAAAMPGTLQFSSATYSGGEGGSPFTVTVTRTGGSDGTVTVDYATSNGTATGGASCTTGIDYVSTSGTLTFMNGETSKTFNVTICDDSDVEGNETINYTLSNPTGGATLGTPSTAVQTIVDNDSPAPTFSFSIGDAKVVEGNSGTVNAVFNVTLTANMPVNNGGGPIASVQYSTANGTATAGSDYTATSGTLNFNSTGTMQITVPVNGDTVKESNEFFYVNLSSPSINASITDGQGVGIIVDDDRAYRADYDRDLKADFSVYRPGSSVFYVSKSTKGFPIFQALGATGDISVPGDYDGDGKADFALFRPSTGDWTILRSSDNTTAVINWGVGTDKPVQGDYNGDGLTDVAVYRPSEGTWYIQPTGGVFYTVQFGISTDKLVQGDYDGDFKTDVAVYRDGVWYVLRSSDGGVMIENWGLPTDSPVVGDFDGDGRVDLTVFRDGAWYIFRSLTHDFVGLSWGVTGDIPAPADFDGDGTTDVTVFRPSGGDWYVLYSSGIPPLGYHWGQNGDVPTPASYIPQ